MISHYLVYVSQYHFAELIFIVELVTYRVGEISSAQIIFHILENFLEIATGSRHIDDKLEGRGLQFSVEAPLNDDLEALVNLQEL